MRSQKSDRLVEKCAVAAVYAPGGEAARLTYFCLAALQHRGQESSGIVTGDGEGFRSHIKAGLVAQVYTEEDLQNLDGHMAIGHNRYATSGGKHDKHMQPVLRGDDVISLAHNGNLPSTVALREFLKSKNLLKRGSNDSEMMADAIRYYMYQGKDVATAIKAAWPLFTGAFSCVVLNHDGLYAFRDHCGIRPLSIGKLKDGYVVASETCAFDIVGAKHIRDVKPGELIRIDESGITSWQVQEANPKLEIFEFIYFARPDSILAGKLVNEVRRNLGYNLASESPVDADLVIPVPDSSIPAALGYSYKSGIEFDHGLIKNRYIHRSFIEPTQELRERAVQMKLNPLPEHLKGKRVVLIDDSIVRGTTAKQLVKMLRKSGAAEVHLRISCPPIKFPDFYGIDTPDQSQLLASQKSTEEICKYLGADSLAFLSYDKMIAAVGVPEDKLCTACFSGNYPIDLLERSLEVTFPKTIQNSSIKEVLV
jgi:amidophosphoribosyltransferase